MTLPETDAWLARLPQGLDSYPDHLQKASILRQFLADTELPPELVDALPAPVAELVRDPPPANTWLPEVRVETLFQAAAERLYPRPDAWQAHWVTINRHLLSGPLYKALMLVATPSLVLKGADVRWGALHRGMTLGVRELEPGIVDASLTYPPHLLPERVALTNAGGFQAILLGAGARDPTARLAAFGPTSCRFVVRWR